MTTPDSDPVDAWLRRELGLQPPLRPHQVAGGLSNVTSIVVDGNGRRVVVRRPPDGVHGGGAHDVLREARIMTALLATEVPVPRVVATADPVPGAPWPAYAMDYVDGVVVDSTTVVDELPAGTRHALGLGLVDVLVAVQGVDLGATGLGDLRRGTTYIDRQLRRWRSQWSATATRSVPAVDRVADRLERQLAGVPAQPDCLVHGDFRFGNVMIGPGRPPRIAALLDWELATTGHPLADLGFLGARMHAPSGVLADAGDPSAAAGMPTFDELTEHYHRRTGVPIDAVPLFVALSAWRWAIIVAGIARRFEEGRMGQVADDADWQHSRVGLLAALAEEWLGA